MLKYLRNEKGVALILLALSIIVLFGIGALAVDIGHMYNVKNQLQAAADSGALAGAAKLAYSDDLSLQEDARYEAQRYAARNTADVAYSSSVPGVSEGSPIPVTLQSNDTNNAAGDIVIGYWDQYATPQFTTSVPSGKYYNAVKVVARRTGANAYQPRVQSMFARVLKLLGTDFDRTSISAEAIASNDLPPLITPIIINEYWGETTAQSTSTKPYGLPQYYPNSFVRRRNVYAPYTSMMWGNTFAIMGQSANPNIGPPGSPYANNPNGFVCMDLRYTSYDQSSTQYQVKPGNTDCSSSKCDSSFGARTMTDSDLKKSAVDYLYSGYPYDRILPTAVTEAASPSGWPNAPPYSAGCPYATLVYFEGGGAEKLPAYPVGRRLICMVYDGTHQGTGTFKLATIVGYTVVEVDGYDSGANPPNGLWSIHDPNHLNPDEVYQNNRDVLGKARLGTGTLYAHAVTDIYAPNAGESGCQFVERLKTEIKKMGSGGVHLVGSGVKYGVTGTNQY